MRYPDPFLDEIRARLPVSQVVGRKVALKRKGREFAGLSPFKVEKTPSFFVNDQKGFYHCFASGEHGDIFKFVMVTEGLTFPEAVERLAAEAGLPLPARDPVRQALLVRQSSLQEVMEEAARFYSDQLLRSEAAPAREYVTKRGIHASTATYFNFGYAHSGRTTLKDYLIRMGFTEAQLIECGLLIKPEDGRPTFDRFRNRIMIPIHDARGKVIAFGGRAIDPEIQPKYLNSPETPLFHKGNNVFNFHRARETSFKSDELVVVEGYMDAIAVHQAGIPNVVAVMGTALTEQQIQMLWRLSSEPNICFDGDSAGREAVVRAVDRILPLLKVGVTAKFSDLTAEKDPDDYIKKLGASAFIDVLKCARSLHDALWDNCVNGVDVSTPEAKAVLEQTIMSKVRSIPEPLVGKAYWASMRLRLSRYFWESDKKVKPAKKKSTLIAPGASIVRIVLGMCVEYPLIFDENLEKVESIDLADPRLATFRDELVRILTRFDDRTVQSFYRNIQRDFYDMLDEVHGAASGRNRCGYRLFQRCPALNYHPSDEFVREIFDMMMMKLDIENQTIEIRQLALQITEENEARFYALIADAERAQADIVVLEARLDEEFKALQLSHRLVSSAANDLGGRSMGMAG